MAKRDRDDITDFGEKIGGARKDRAVSTGPKRTSTEPADTRPGWMKRFLAAERRGCVCPPEAPVCVCGKAPRLRLVTRPSLAPTDDEITTNPRARSARLRAAERLAA